MKIRAIACAIPKDGINNIENAAVFGETRVDLEKKIGAIFLPRISERVETSDMVVDAVRNVCALEHISKESIEALVVVTQNGDRGQTIPHVSAVAHAKLGLPSGTVAFDIGLGCSGYVYGLHILRGLMLQLGLNRGVLVTADPYSKIIDPTDRSTTLLFGDASSATLVDNEGQWSIGRSLLETDGTGSDHIRTDEHKFIMNGRQVFNFAVTRVPEQIRRLLSLDNLTESDIDAFILHQGSAAVVKAIASKFPASSERFPCELKNTGNTVSSSIPLILSGLIKDKKNKRFVLSGFGVGLSWGSTIITREASEGINV